MPIKLQSNVCIKSIPEYWKSFKRLVISTHIYAIVAKLISNSTMGKMVLFSFFFKSKLAQEMCFFFLFFPLNPFLFLSLAIYQFKRTCNNSKY